MTTESPFTPRVCIGQEWEEDSTGEIFVVRAIYGTTKPVHVWRMPDGMPRSLDFSELFAEYTEPPKP